MVAVLLIGGGLGWLVHSAKVQRDAVADIRRAGGAVVYSWKPGGRPDWIVWIGDRIGIDYFGHVRGVILKTSITDAILESVGRLAGLQALYLNKGGAVSSAGIGHLKGLTRLTHFSTHESIGSDTDLVSGLENARHLEFLVLRGIKLTPGDLARLGRFGELRYLALYDCGLDDDALAHFAGLATLDALDLSENPLTGAGLAHLRGLRDLRCLKLRQTNMTGEALGHLGGMEKLSVLILDRTPIDDLSKLPPFPRLDLLTLEGCPIGDEDLPPITRLASLRDLQLQRTRVTDAGLPGLIGMPSLKTVTLFGTPVTGPGLTAARSARPSLIFPP